ncbi:ras and Rab interactor 3 [Pristis pectinata]|uniref:ras and Rab interactor 3 n=1 Tax=Pristis pectinata TaxID=685728 RepID=UPI00223D7F8E|nr:ras and Rab interactor 3 [Pristis pectinata]
MMKRTSGEEVGTGDMPGPPLGANDECQPPHLVPSQPTPFPGISILDKLIRTCPVWLQLNTRKERVAEVLHIEPRGTFMVRKDCTLTNMVLSVNFPGADGTPKILEYSIKEENSIMYLDGSLLVFDDIFKMVAFYCVSRDILPSPLILPQVIAEATNSEELEVVSHLGMDFWNSYINRGYREGSLKVSEDLNVINRQTQNFAIAPHMSTDRSTCSCEIELSAGNDKLWFVNPVFIKEYCSTAPSSGPPPEQSSDPVINTDLKVRRPPPLPPRPKLSEVIAVLSDNCRGRSQLIQGEEPKKNTEVYLRKKQESFVEPIKELGRKEVEIRTDSITMQNRGHLPPIPPRRRPVERQLTDTTSNKSEEMTQSNGGTQNGELSDQTCIKSAENEQNPLLSEKSTNVDEGLNNSTPVRPGTEQRKQSCQPTPIAPPRRKKIARKENEQEDAATGQENKTPTSPELDTAKDLSEDASDSSGQSLTSADSQSVQPCNFTELKMADESLYSPECNVLSPIAEMDSYSTSSTEEELDSVNTPLKLKKQRHSMMLNKARNRLSIMAITNVLNAFRSTDRKILKKITELAQEKGSYFGQLIQDYRAYTLEMMGSQTSSTEMLQEIRQMMTQLKSYLLQSTELTLMTDSSYQSEDKLEAVVEAALCKCVLKPLRDNINTQLKEIHSKNGNLKLLKENQQIVQNTTTTELGVTTSVPEVSVLEKIHQKLSTMHQTYSPDKKVTYLLKSCKMIYDSMSVGNNAKSHGADDFLPVLMYVLARSDLTSLLLDVEYMMELLDPSLHLGEGYYYLTTTYGALEHIKHFDKQTVTRQLSHEVQDSIHQWERRRTLNMKQVSRSSMQDFLSVCFLEFGSNIKTFAINPETTAEKLSKQCAEKFGVSESKDYCMHLIVEEKSMQLAPDAVPHHLKSILRKRQPQKDYCFIYKQANQAEETDNPPIKDLPPF